MPAVFQTLFRSMLVALGLMAGHGLWASIGVRATNRAMAFYIAYFDSDAEVMWPVVDDSVRGIIFGSAGGLWTSVIGLHEYIAWSPAWLVARFVALTAFTFTLWCIAVWLVRLLSCRGVGRLSSPLDLAPGQRVVPPWCVIAISPLFGLLGAVSLAFTYALATAYAVRPWPGDYPWASSPEHVGWTVASAFSISLALVWAVGAIRAVRARQARDHNRGVYCSRCGYTFGGIATTTCPECGTAPPPLPPRTRRSTFGRGVTRSFITFLVLISLLAAFVGAGASGAIPGLVMMAIDNNRYVGREGANVSVPLHRPVIVHGEWGAVYFVAAPIHSTGQTLLRAVYVQRDGDAPTQVVTRILEAQGPNTLPMADVPIDGIDSRFGTGLMARVYNRSFADPNSRFVIINQFAQLPKRITALPREHDTIPEPIREILDSTFPDEQAARQLLHSTGPTAPSQADGQEP